MRSLLSVDVSQVTDDELTTLYRFPDQTDRAYVRAIFINSADGSAQGPDGASASLSSAGDRRVFTLQRSLCDVVLVGAGTARVEGYRPVEPSEVDAALRRELGLAETPAIAVVSRSMDLDPALLGPAPAETIVITTQDAPSNPLAVSLGPDRLIRAGVGGIDVRTALEALQQKGFHRVLCEGGPTLLGDVVAAGRLDDLCLTIAPVLVGGAGRRILQGPQLEPAPRMRLAHLLEEDGFFFARYRVERTA